MSNSLLNLCWPLQLPPVPKFVLISLADSVNEARGTRSAWPSLNTLADRTGFSRRAVVTAIHALERAGVIEADRSRRARTYYTVQPENYRAHALPISKEALSRAKARLARDDYRHINEHCASGVQRTLNTSQGVEESNRLDAHEASAATALVSASGALADAEGLREVVHQFPMQVMEVHTNQKEPKTQSELKQKEAKNLSDDLQPRPSRTAKRRVPAVTDGAMVMQLPDWLDVACWQSWIRDRAERKKPVTQAAAALQISRLGRLRAEGFSPQQVVEHSIMNGYAGLFPPSNDGKTSSSLRSSHAGFDDKNYREGVKADGTLL